MNGKHNESNIWLPTTDELRSQLGDTALAFRGYNVTNLGRTPELLEHPVYGKEVLTALKDASHVCSDLTGRKCDLVDRVRRREETNLESYADAIALIMSVSIAQIRILESYFDVTYRRARMTFGYSLGEIVALIASGMLELQDAMRIPLLLAADCVAAAHDTTLAVFFTRGRALQLKDIQQACFDVNQEGKGVVGVSSILSPNSVLLIGQGKSLDAFHQRIGKKLTERTILKKNPHQWPPLHTPIVWQKNVADQAAVLLQSLKIAQPSPQPPVLSLVTGEMSYDEYTIRTLLRRWIDEPQQLWSAVCETLAMKIKTILHVGPEPNIIPATYKRLSDNVIAERQASFGLKALSAVVDRPWLRAFLPERVSLLRAPSVRHINLEDWLLNQKV